MQFSPYEGGLPVLTTRSRQRGTGFLSAARRYLLPVARTALPHVFGAIKDVVSGEKDVKSALLGRAKDFGGDVLSEVKERFFKSPRKRAAPPPQKVSAKKKKIEKKKPTPRRR